MDCGYYGIATVGVKSYHEEIFGLTGYVITSKMGQLLEHPIEGACFDFTLGDPDYYRPENME